MPDVHLLRADAGRLPLRDGSVHLCVTSPPYLWQRVYNAPLQVFGGDPACAHEWRWYWDDQNPHGDDGTDAGLDGGTATQAQTRHGKVRQAFCQHCGAWLGQLGLEPTVDAYIAHLVSISREVWRVLHEEGQYFVVIDDKRTNDRQWSMVPERFALAMQADGWRVEDKVVWHKLNCLSGNCRVYARTQKGEMPMSVKDMVRLDPATVRLWNGARWTQVIGFYENHSPIDPIKLRLRSGETISCTPEHRWPTQRGLISASELVIGDVLDICQLPEPENPNEPIHIPDSMGWFVGMYLAEGSKYGDLDISIACHAKEIERYERIQAICKDYDTHCGMYSTSENGAVINISSRILRAIIETYISGKTAKDKHLSVTCWARSNQFLYNILLGYLEGDGHNDTKNDRWRLGFTRNYNLEADLRTLCARLGIGLRLRKTYRRNTTTGKDHPAYSGEIRFNKTDHFNCKQDAEIISIEHAKGSKFWDIAVADEPHLFALASGVLTHNCMPGSQTNRFTHDFENVWLFNKSREAFFDMDAVREATDRKVCWVHYHEDNSDPGGGGFRGEGGYRKPLNPAGRSRRAVWSLSSAGTSYAHYAPFPPALVDIMIRACSSEAGSCPACGRQWRRVVERERPPTRAVKSATPPGQPQQGLFSSARFDDPIQVHTLGFAPACVCDLPPVPSVILDPFSGTGTTGVVAQRLGRRAVCCDLSGAYLDMARERTGLDAWRRWHGGNGKAAEADLSGLPLFAGGEV